jgi:hypothetical protein
MEREIQKLRAALARLERGRGKRYGSGLRQQIAAAATELRRRGHGWQRIGTYLGIPHETVRRFVGAAEQGGFVPVVVTELEPKSGGFVLVTPEGHRIEGLAVADVAEILRRLR